jgi:hypothetical protein
MALDMLAEQINGMIEEDFLNGNQVGITNMEQTESWSYVELFKETIHYESPYLLKLQNEGFIGDMMEFAYTIGETLSILEEITIRIRGGVGNHLTVLNRELPQQQSLARGEELGQPHKKPYQRWYRLLYTGVVTGKNSETP